MSIEWKKKNNVPNQRTDFLLAMELCIECKLNSIIYLLENGESILILPKNQYSTRLCLDSFYYMLCVSYSFF